MISNKYKILILVVVLIFLIKTSSYASAKDTIIKYDITEDATEDFVDIEKTDLEIDNERQLIRLSEEDIMGKVKFINDENSPVAYSVMTGSGIVQYAFDGEKMVEIDNLEVEIDNPLAYAIKLNSPDLVVAVDREEEEKDIIYYSYGSDGMIENPFLSINGLTEIRSMAFVNENDLAVLKNDRAITYKLAGDEMINIPDLSIDNLDNPLDIASRNKHSITILEENKIRRFEFNGTGYSEIPGLYLDENIRAKAMATAKDQVSIIDDKNVYTYLMSDENFAYVKALSITESLESPCAVGVHKDRKDLLVLDKENGKAKVKYFSFGEEDMMEIPELSVEVENVILGNVGKYALDGELISKPLAVKGSYINLIQVGAYSYLEKDTSITFYISKGKESKVWLPMWKLERWEDKRTELYKNIEFGEDKVVWEYEGRRNEIYPQNLDFPESVVKDVTDFEVIENEDGDIELNPSRRTDDWFEIPIDLEDIDDDSSYIRLKMKFKSKNGETTPYVYVPYENNDIYELNDEDDIAIKIIGRKKPGSPIIDDIDDGVGNLPGLKRKKGWVYSTTPTIKWRIPGIVKSENYQSGCQLVIMADTDEGWKPALITDKITGDSGERQEYVVPTSEKPNIEGPLFDSGEYKFAVFVRVWDMDDTPSDFSVGKRFNVLAYERPRITNIISTPNGDFSNTIMIKKGMKEDSLPLAKAGTAITLTIDSVGPIENDVEDGEEISKIFYQKDNKNIYINKGEITSGNSPGSSINTWDITFWTNASVLEVPEETIIRAILAGDSDEGGTTVFCIPRYAEGVARIKDTVYTEWNVFLKGRNND